MARGWINPKFNLELTFEKSIDIPKTSRGWTNPKYTSKPTQPTYASGLKQLTIEQPNIERSRLVYVPKTVRGWVNPKYASQLEQSTIEPTPLAEKSYEPSVLDLKKVEYHALFEEAANRMTLIKDKNLMSAALMEFESEGDFVPLSSIQSEEELFTEATRIRAFLAHDTSTVEGAEIFTAESIALAKYGKAFEYENQPYRKQGFNPETNEVFQSIDLSREKAAWATFRELRSKDQAWITEHYGYGKQATNALVSQIYDELEGVPENELISWSVTEEGLQSSGLVNERAFNIIHQRLQYWNTHDLQPRHLSNSFKSHNTGNFSSTGNTGDIMTEREF